MEVRQTSRHIAEVHLKMSLHQCPLCDYGAAESRLVRRHMKNGHRKKEIKVSYSNLSFISEFDTAAFCLFYRISYISYKFLMIYEQIIFLCLASLLLYDINKCEYA